MANNDKSESSLDNTIRVGINQLLPECKIIHLQRQARWRPAWDIIIQIDGIEKKIHVRAEKGENYTGPLTLSEEAEVHHILERHGIPVPHVYGMLENPSCIVMDFLPGQVNLATAATDTDRETIRRQYIEALVKLHQIPVKEFSKIGLNMPVGAKQTALNLYSHCETIYRRKMVNQSFPLMEFIWQWVRNNAPRHRERQAFITADSGQFLFDGDQLSGLIDFEVGYIGDPLAEFAGMRLRDSTEPLGNIDQLIEQYESLTGDMLDKPSIEFHTAGFCAVNGFLLWPLVFNPGRGDDYVAYLSFSVGTSRWAINAIAEYLGLTLENPPEPVSLPLTFEAAGEHLIENAAALGTEHPSLEYEVGKLESLSKYMSRYNRYGRSMEIANIEDASRLTGKRFNSPEEAEQGIVDLIKQEKSENDALLVQYFHRWLQRMDFILNDCGSSSYLTGIDLQTINH